MSAKNVVDISSDEEDNATMSGTKSKSNGKQPMAFTRTAIKSPSRTIPSTNTPTASAPASGNCPVGLTDPETRSQSADSPPSQTEQEAPQDRTLSSPRSTAILSASATTPLSPLIDDEPPKPTPLDINEFRHLVSAGSIPAKDSPLIMSIQPACTATNKRKAADIPENDHPTIRPRPTPMPPSPYTGTSEHPMPPTKTNTLLWSIPAYKPPQSPTKTPSPPTQPSIPNIHAPSPVPPSPHPPTTPRPRTTKWTHAHLANLASALETAFLPAAPAFARANAKTERQVWDAYSFLVNKRIFEFSDEGGGEGGGDGDGEGEGEGEKRGRGMGRGRGRGRGKVARRFEREMGRDRKSAEKKMRQVHDREASLGHWASEGMSGRGRAGGRGRGSGRGGV